MIKKFTLLLLVALSLVTTAKAKTLETILWNDTYTDGVELNGETVATFKAGDVLRVYVTVPEGGANFKIVYKGAPDWNETTIPSINNQWPWVNYGDTYKDFTLTDADITALAGKNIYIYKGENSTIDKVCLLKERKATDLWSGTNALGEWGNFESLRYEGKGELANANVGDDIRVTFTNATEGWQVYVCDAASYGEFTGGYFDGSAQEEAQTVSFRIANATVLEAIQDRGIVVKGKRVTLTKIEIVTYTTSYDAVAVTIGDDGIATFSSSKHLDFEGTGVTPYYASSVTTGKVTLTAVTKTKKWAGYIVKGAAGSYNIPVIDGDEDWLDAFNNLRAMNESSGAVYRSAYSEYTDGDDSNNTDTTTDEYKIQHYFRYIFAKHGANTPGFYLLGTDYSEGGNPYHTLAAHKAYLETDTNLTPTGQGNAPALKLIFGGEGEGTTGINTVSKNPVVEDGVYYNLQGVAVKNPSKGLYILNGKKVIVK